MPWWAWVLLGIFAFVILAISASRKTAVKMTREEEEAYQEQKKKEDQDFWRTESKMRGRRF